jgi:DNA-binding phage protein
LAGIQEAKNEKKMNRASHRSIPKEVKQMALTKEYRKSVVERIQRDPEYTAALYAEAISSMVEGDKATALSILRDLVHAHITFKNLAAETGVGEKALHRMLGARGNPTAENLCRIMHTIEQDLRLTTEVTTKVRKRTHSVPKRELTYA